MRSTPHRGPWTTRFLPPNSCRQCHSPPTTTARNAARAVMADRTRAAVSVPATRPRGARPSGARARFACRPRIRADCATRERGACYEPEPLQHRPGPDTRDSRRTAIPGSSSPTSSTSCTASTIAAWPMNPAMHARCHPSTCRSCPSSLTPTCHIRPPQPAARSACRPFPIRPRPSAP
jgi:hypothetical protein